jgi:hypothetical protein
MKAIYLIFFLVSLFQLGYSQDLPNTIVLVSMPNDKAEFKNIFQRNPSDHEMINIISLFTENSSVKNINFLRNADDIDKILKNVIDNYRNGKKDLSFPKLGFSVIGHNEKGNFYFPDGNHVTLQEVERKLQDFAVMFLSCNSKSILPHSATAIDYKLSYNEAFNIAKDFNSEVYNCNIWMKSVKQVADETIAKLNKQHNSKYAAKFLGTAGGSLGTFILLKSMDTNESKPDSIKVKSIPKSVN